MQLSVQLKKLHQLENGNRELHKEVEDLEKEGMEQIVMYERQMKDLQ